MAPGRVKRESTIAFGGLNTPAESFHSTGTVTPKHEEIDLTYLSDTIEDFFQGQIKSHDGLPPPPIEDYPTQAEQQRRSASGKSELLAI